jgi:hypothetical protein
MSSSSDEHTSVPSDSRKGAWTAKVSGNIMSSWIQRKHAAFLECNPLRLWPCCEFRRTSAYRPACPSMAPSHGQPSLLVSKAAAQRAAVSGAPAWLRTAGAAPGKATSWAHRAAPRHSYSQQCFFCARADPFLTWFAWFCVIRRWYNQLCPGVKRTPFSEWEQAVIIKVICCSVCMVCSCRNAASKHAV